MKLISTALGKIIVAATSALILLLFLSNILIPGMRDFVSMVFPDEKNYIETSSDNLTLTCADDVVKISSGTPFDKDVILSNITAKLNDEDIVSQLQDDLDKSVEERSQVFIYKINEDGTAILQSEIDTSRKGEWAVFYLLKDGYETASLKVSYFVG